VNAAGEDVIALDHAMEELGALDDRKARVVELRCFLGCTIEETAEVLGVGHATVEREFQFAKTWLFARLYPE
jgi:DNA-directed RNA polymerase specialized sigma24 family protein